MLTSCGSTQYAGYDNDGIYSTKENGNVVTQETTTTSTNDYNYYKNYFSQNLMHFGYWNSSILVETTSMLMKI